MSSTTTTTDTTTTRGGGLLAAPPGLVFLAVAVLCTAAALTAGLFLGARFDDAAPGQAVTGSSVDAGFARDMQAHHAQAVEMSLLVREVTDDSEIRLLALDILTTQQQQIGQLYGWLELWGLSQTTAAPPMQWMSTESPTDSTGSMTHTMNDQPAAADESMPGMATSRQLQTLATLRGPDAERLYLRLMIRHHQGALNMATAAAAEASTPQVRRLAQGIVEAQTAEISAMRQLLETRAPAKDR